MAAIEAAVGSLPPDLRTAFVLAEYEGAGHAEIAEALGCSRKGAEMRLYRARQALREKLAPFLKS
jgi:RNA polymerase sigma-70 factor (ECF subfamily)